MKQSMGALNILWVSMKCAQKPLQNSINIYYEKYVMEEILFIKESITFLNSPHFLRWMGG